MTRILLLCILAVAFWAPASYSDSYFPDRYDQEIERAQETFLPGVDWRLLKAQYYQESLLDPDAVSPVGAAGVAQFMPATWLEVSRELDMETMSPHMAEPAIQAGAYYMAKLRRIWSAPRPEPDRHSLAMASYNAGAGNLIQAQKLCGGPNAYRRIAACLHQVTGRHHRETLTYVERIWRYWTRMVIHV